MRNCFLFGFGFKIHEREKICKVFMNGGTQQILNLINNCRVDMRFIKIVDFESPNLYSP